VVTPMLGLPEFRLGLLLVAGVLLAVAALLGLVRMSRGPTTLDRVVASDLLVGVVIAGLAIEAAVNRHTTTAPIMLVLAAVGFAGPVAMARFIFDPSPPERPGAADEGHDGEGAR